MAAKTKGTRNGERKNGKAWGKGHNAPVKALSVEAQERKAHKDAARARRAPVSAKPGSNFTLFNVTWEWSMHTMAARWPNTRKVRALDTWIARGKES